MATRVKLQWDGMDDLKAALRSLPEDLHDAAFDIMETEMHAAKADIEAAYPEVTGNLKRGLKIERRAGLLRTVMVLSNTAKHAHLYESGTAARHYFTKKNVKHVVGAMPAFHTFIPRIIRHRAAFYDKLADLLERHGLLVTGRAA